jgi:NAD(P)-dependent dehydrogenase (short-subunit alcohol dehydrogenase family)
MSAPPEQPSAPRKVLVTGSSRGIGRTTAVAFASQGDTVAVHYASSRDDAEQTLALLPGTGHVAIAGDIGDLAVARSLARP